MKEIKTRTPAAVAVELDQLPNHTSDAMCRTLIGCVDRLFKDPAIVAEYKDWQKRRQQKEQK